jgi:archaemetzincin
MFMSGWFPLEDWKGLAVRNVLLAVLLFTLSGCHSRAAEPPSGQTLASKYRRLLPLHERLAAPKPGEWLAEHHEPGQTFRQYVAARPVRPTAQRRVIYIQPIGEFDATQRKIVDLTAQYMAIYFGLPTKVRETLSLEVIPEDARRTHPTWGDKQILSTYVLDGVLRRRLPSDACVFLAFTTSDLWPGAGWNFVFGQASLRQRVGVWSIYRNGDPKTEFELCLRRTLKTATHETGHMFSMMHCIWYECNMAGSNHRAESDRHPLWLCPHCLAKLCYATGVDPARRYEKLAAFCRECGLRPEEEFFRKSLAKLEGK